MPSRWPYRTLFIFSAETLAILVKQNKDIKGVVINDKEQNLSQYADNAFLVPLDYFSRISGLNINSWKT